MPLYYGLFFTFLLIFMVYLAPTHKFYSRPHYLLLLGFGVCVFAATVHTGFSIILDNLPNKFDPHYILVFQQILLFTLASLGGAIIGGAFMLRVQKMHKIEKRSLSDRLAYLEEDTERARREWKEANEEGNEALMSLADTDIFTNRVEIKKIQKELAVKEDV